MDINAVSKALHVLDYFYLSAHEYRGYALTLEMKETIRPRYKKLSGNCHRRFLTLKAKGLIAHDQVLNGDVRVR